MVLCDGTNVAVARRLPRTSSASVTATSARTPGGMGAYAPMPSMTPELVDEVMESIVAPTVRELQRRDIDYRGVLYAGVMLTSKGPKLLEYNARFGDPETEVLVPLYGDGLFDLLLRRRRGPPRRCDARRQRAPRSRSCSPSHGYPAVTAQGRRHLRARRGRPTRRSPSKASRSFTPAPRRDDDGRFVTAGGRVLAVTGVGDRSRTRAQSRLSRARRS